ncbi:MAG: hypothetical protein QG668_5 [Patescibacteria group bacterium]|nr:hypothetical protein [Patescibacteria group bacterium]
MSWSRILRFARERQVPVIVTNETGEDPLILLSLDQLEEALGGAVDPSPTPMPTSPRPPTPSFVPEDISEPVLPEGSGEFALDEQGVTDEAVTEKETLADADFTTQEEGEGGPKQAEVTSAEIYGEIMVAPHIEVSHVMQEVSEGGVVPPEEESVPDVAQEPSAEGVNEELAPAVIWEEGELPMPQGEEGVAMQESPQEELPKEAEKSPVEAPVETSRRPVETDVSLEERFFLDF